MAAKKIPELPRFSDNLLKAGKQNYVVMQKIFSPWPWSQ